jgi:electron transfer flavoprotein beta subunit
MNIVVLVKQVPDTEGDRKLDPSDNTLDRATVDSVINYIDEFAIEEALRLKEAQGGEVTILTVGPERATESIRKALSMGADQALHISDEAIHGSDVIATAKVIAQALGTVGPGARRLQGDRRISRPVGGRCVVADGHHEITGCRHNSA